MSEQVEKRPSREWVKFGVLALILLGTIVVVSWARPFIFERVVPVIMGEGEASTPAEEAQPAPETPVDEAYPAAVEGLSPAEAIAPAAAYPAAAEQAVDNAAGSVESAYPIEDVVVVTAVPPITHTVQPGENIIQIAETYHTTVDAITTANNLTNPNHIEAGMTLVIPQETPRAAAHHQ